MKRLTVVLVLISTFVSVIAAQQVREGEAFYQAIRTNDLAALRSLVTQYDPNVKLSNGLTPLIVAASVGTRDAVTLLVQAGADVNARATSGLTALHVAWRDEGIARLLLEHGALIEAKTDAGATPLCVASSWNGTTAVVKLLLDRGADANAADNRGLTPLLVAARVGNGGAAKLLLERHANAAVHATDPGAAIVTPLMAAAFSGDTELARLFVARKPDINAVSGDYNGTVKNGPVNFGRFSALHHAVMSRSEGIVKLLLDAEASVNARDIRGMTPLMLAVSNDHPNIKLIRVLIEHGADTSIASSTGETVFDWARKFNNPAVMELLNVHAEKISAAAAPLPVTYTEASIRQTVDRGLPLLHTGSSRVMSDGGCVACHAQPLTGMATEYASRRGWYNGSKTADVSQGLATLMTAAMNNLAGREGGGLPESEEYNLFMMATAGLPPNLGTDVFAYYLAGKQREAGNWHGFSTRPPMEDSDIMRTALGIRVLTAYSIPARKEEFESRVRRAAEWLATQTPTSTDERIMQLLGLHWANANAPVREKRLKELKALQRQDGGWAQTPYLPSDAYATGQVLFTLHELGVTANKSARSAVAFLLRNQQKDGSWYVKSRAVKLQPYFQSGFPYEHDQWISQAATAWAVIGLSVSDMPAGFQARSEP